MQGRHLSPNLKLTERLALSPTPMAWRHCRWENNAGIWYTVNQCTPSSLLKYMH